MGYHKSSVFKGSQVGVNTQMKEIVVPFMIEMHYFIHQINLVVLVLLKLNLVVWWNLYYHIWKLCMNFPLSLNRFFEYQKFYNVLTKKRNKSLKNAKMQWVYVLFPMKCVMEQYYHLIAKMHVDAPRSNTSNDNLSLPYDLEII
jgi:hypothetical protein